MRTSFLQFLTIAALGVSCSIHIGDLKEKASAEADVSFTISANVQRLTIETFNGSLELVESDQAGQDLRISGASKIWASANTQEEAAVRLAEMDWVYTESGNEATISLTRPSSRSSNTGGSLSRLVIPTGLAVKLDSNNGSLSLTGACENFALETSNGRVTVQLTGDWSGNGSCESSNGRIAVRCDGLLDCRLDMKTSNGKPKVLGPPLSKETGTGSLRLRTSNGHITVTHLFDSE